MGHFRDVLPTQLLSMVLKKKLKEKKSNRALINRKTRNDAKRNRFGQLLCHPAWKWTQTILITHAQANGHRTDGL